LQEALLALLSVLMTLLADFRAGKLVPPPTLSPPIVIRRRLSQNS
jgi:hypothetical protein